MTVVEAPYARRRAFVVIALLAAVLGLGWVASVSPIVAIEHVVVTGTRQLTVEQVVDAGAIRRGDSLVWLRTGHAAAAIRALPYADAVTVTREWPHTVRVVVSERTPVAWFAQGTTAWTTDATGRVLARVQAAPPGLPQLLGLKRTAAPGGWVAPAAGAAAAAALPDSARPTMKSVTNASDGSLTVQTTGGVEVRLGPPVRVAVKVRAAVAVLVALGDRKVAYVDVSVPTNPVAG